MNREVDSDLGDEFRPERWTVTRDMSLDQRGGQ